MYRKDPMRIDNNPFLDKHVQYGKATADKLRLDHIHDETTSPGYQRTTVTANDIEPGSRDQLLIRALATDKLSYACTADMPMLEQMESEHLVRIMHKTYHIEPGSRDQLLIRALATDKLSYACTADMPMLEQMESEHLVRIMHKTYHMTPLWPKRYYLTEQGKIEAAQAYDRLLGPNTKG